MNNLEKILEPFRSMDSFVVHLCHHLLHRTYALLPRLCLLASLVVHVHVAPAMSAAKGRVKAKAKALAGTKHARPVDTASESLPQERPTSRTKRRRGSVASVDEASPSASAPATALATATATATATTSTMASAPPVQANANNTASASAPPVQANAKVENTNTVSIANSDLKVGKELSAAEVDWFLNKSTEGIKFWHRPYPNHFDTSDSDSWDDAKSLDTSLIRRFRWCINEMTKDDIQMAKEDGIIEIEDTKMAKDGINKVAKNSEQLRPKTLFAWCVESSIRSHCQGRLFESDHKQDSVDGSESDHEKNEEDEASCEMSMYECEQFILTYYQMGASFLSAILGNAKVNFDSAFVLNTTESRFFLSYGGRYGDRYYFAGDPRNTPVPAWYSFASDPGLKDKFSERAYFGSPDYKYFGFGPAFEPENRERDAFLYDGLVTEFESMFLFSVDLEHPDTGLNGKSRRALAVLERFFHCNGPNDGDSDNVTLGHLVTTQYLRTKTIKGQPWCWLMTIKGPSVLWSIHKYLQREDTEIQNRLSELNRKGITHDIIRDVINPLQSKQSDLHKLMDTVKNTANDGRRAMVDAILVLEAQWKTGDVGEKQSAVSEVSEVGEKLIRLVVGYIAGLDAPMKLAQCFTVVDDESLQAAATKAEYDCIRHYAEPKPAKA